MKSLFSKMKMDLEMDWNSLKLFLAISSGGTLAAAAKTLSVSNTTVFRHLNAFEEELGTRLFDRIKGRYELTETGEELAIYAGQISTGFHQIERKIVGRDVQTEGIVKLTAPESLSYYFLARYLKDFKRLHPKIQVDLITENDVFNLTDRKVDVVLRISNNPPDHLVGRKIRQIKWGVYGGDIYLAEKGMPTDLDTLTEHSIIGGIQGQKIHNAYDWLDKNRSDQIIQRSNDVVTMSHFARENNGLAILPDDLCIPGLKRCFTFEPAGENILWVLTHPDLRHVERIKLVMQYLANAFRNDAVFDADT